MSTTTTQSNDMTEFLNKVTTITQHGEKHLLPTSQLLNNAISNSQTRSLRPIAVTPLSGQFLSLLTRLTHSTRILEIGTLGGYSTLWFALSQPLPHPSSTTTTTTNQKIHVTTIEINPKHAQVARENTHGQGVSNVEIVLGGAVEVMTSWLTPSPPSPSSEPTREFDLVFIDADWGEQWQCFDLAVQLTRPGGVIVVDNVVREILEESINGKQEIEGETLVTRVGRDTRVQATLLNQVNALKGKDDVLDGVLIAAVL